MPVIWEDKYLEDHTKKQLNALLDSYEKAEWQCPRCLEVNPVWDRMRVVAGWNDFGTKYEVNRECYNFDCGYRRANGKAHNLNGKTPKQKPRKVKPTEVAELRYEIGSSNKFWTAELYKSAKKVVVKWGRWGMFGSAKTFEFDTLTETVEFFHSKIDEKINKGYYDQNKKKPARRSKTTAKRKKVLTTSR